MKLVGACSIGLVGTGLQEQIQMRQGHSTNARSARIGDMAAASDSRLCPE
jgi:hypothetical protein